MELVKVAHKDYILLLAGKSQRAKRLIRDHGKRWTVKERAENWFSPDGTTDDKTGLRVESIGCICQTCIVAKSQHSMWIFATEDKEYRISEIQREKESEGD
jgi:hypothetical protein